MLTDPIANFLTRIRNSSAARQKKVTVRASNLIKAIAKIMLEKNFINNVEDNNINGMPELTIHFIANRDPLNLKRVSKPGQRIYINAKDIKRVRNGFGIGIFSTSAGILTDEQCHAKKIGGEYICEIY